MTSDVVLTAAHVLKDADSIRVRFPAGKESDAQLLWTAGDLAALQVAPHVGLPTVRYGLVADQSDELPCQALGYPWFKMRKIPDGNLRRVSFQLIGAILTRSNDGTGTFDVGVNRPPAEMEGRSPWKGMSGAALFVRDRLVGIISEHHLREGTGHLTALRADWTSTLTPAQCERIGYSRVIPVNPPPGRGPHGYLASVRGLVPAGGLQDRDQELRELAAFCWGEEPYLRVCGPAWSGKTALASSLALRPPPGVRVAAYFAFGPGADSDAYSQAMREQLAAIAEAPTGTAHLDDLLDKAAQRCQENDERLLLVVDGLDEDRGTGPSIASQLPLSPPEGVRVLVTGRRHPGIPDHVPSAHPLRTCRIRDLTANAHTKHLEYEAKDDFKRLIQSHPGSDRPLGVLAAAQGGLTVDDFVALTDLPHGEIKTLLGSRVLTPIADSYQYAHKTLRQMAEQDFAHRLDEFQASIHSWADSYRDRGWPHDTPAYLLTSYGRLLVEPAADRTRLVDYALDHVRHDRMRGLVGGQSAAVRELTAAQRAVSDEPEPDLLTLTRLAITGDRLSQATSPPPVELPALWVGLGQSDRAVTLARSIVDLDVRASALAEVVKAMTERGELSRAWTVALSIDRAERKAWALGAVVRARAERGELNVAEDLARSLSETERRVWALAEIARVSRSVELLDEAERLAPSVVDADSQVWAVMALVEAAASCGDVARAEALVDRLPQASQRVRALSGILKALSGGDDEDRIRTVMARAERTAESIMYDRRQDGAMSALMSAMARCGEATRAADLARRLSNRYARSSALSALIYTIAGGDLTRAVDLADDIPLSARRARVLAGLAKEAAKQNDTVWGVELAEEAQALTHDLTPQGERARAMIEVAAAFGACADPRGEEVASSIESPHHRIRAFIAVAGAVLPDHPDLAEALAERAEALVHSGTSSGQRVRTLVAITAAVSAGGDLSRAEALALMISDSADRTRALSDLVKPIAERDVAWAEFMIRERLGAEDQEKARVVVARVLVAHGEFDRAEKVALSLRSRELRAQALAPLVKEIPQLDRAVAIVRKIKHSDQRRQACLGLVQTMVDQGELWQARMLANELRPVEHRAEVLLVVAMAGGSNRELVKEIKRLIGSVRDKGRRAGLEATLVKTLAGLGQVVHAEQVAQGIGLSALREGALADVAAAYASRGEVETGLAVVEKIRAATPKACAHVAVVKALLGCGQPARAERVARDIGSPEMREGALADVAAAYASRGKARAAMAVVSKIKATTLKGRACIAVVKALADRGQMAEGIEIAMHRIPMADQMAQALAALIRADPGGTRTVAAATERARSLFPDRITHPDEQLTAFVDLLRVIVDSAGLPAGRGLADKIEELTAKVEDPARQARILVALSRTVEPGRGRRLLARVLSGPAWTAALGALAEAEPRALPTIADELLSRHPH